MVSILTAYRHRGRLNNVLYFMGVLALRRSGLGLTILPQFFICGY